MKWEIDNFLFEKIPTSHKLLIAVDILQQMLSFKGGIC